MTDTGVSTPLPPGVKDIAGRRTGRLVAVRYSHKRNQRHYWLFYCDCGRECVARPNNKQKSCGCLLRQHRISFGKLKSTHRQKGTRLYRIWAGMKRRCLAPSSSSYKYYGARGISVCDEWQKSFESFRDWSMANGYVNDLQIDRRDNNGNYCPENCRWVTPTQNANNRRVTVFVEHQGQRFTITELERHLGFSQGMIRNRMRHGMTLEQAINTPRVVPKKKRHKAF